MMSKDSSIKGSVDLEQETHSVGLLDREELERREQISERFSDSEDRDKPLLAGEDKRFHYSERLVVYHKKLAPTVERYRALRSALLAKYDRFSAIITSAQPGEGKSVTALNLGLIFGECPNRRVLVVDADLRKASFNKLLGISSGSLGLSDLLSEKAELEDVVYSTVYPNVFVIPAGKAAQEKIGDLLSAPIFPRIVDRLRSEYDYVFFDTPAANSVADAGIIGQVIGKAIIVVKRGATHRRYISYTVELLRSLGVDIEGFVLTFYKPDIPKYLSYYV